MVQTVMSMVIWFESTPNQNRTSRRVILPFLMGPISIIDAVFSFWIRVMPPMPVFVKQVVRRFHAASLISGTLISFSGLSQTL
jgi:hypothetical protein